MNSWRSWLRRPRAGARLVAAIATVAALLPLLARLPRVSVVACFDSAHPLYQWVPTTGLSTVHCVSAPAPVVSWTLMIAATLIVQLLLLPAILIASGILVRGARRLARNARRTLAGLLRGLDALLLPEPRPCPVPVTVRVPRAPLLRDNPRRGPPAGLC